MALHLVRSQMWKVANFRGILCIMGKKMQLPDEPIYLGRLLNEQRQALGYTLKILGEKSGVDVGQISRFCNGDFKTLSKNLQIILGVLQICWPPPTDEPEPSLEKPEQKTESVPLQLLKEIENGWERAGPRRKAFEQVLVALANVF